VGDHGPWLDWPADGSTTVAVTDLKYPGRPTNDDEGQRSAQRHQEQAKHGWIEPHVAALDNKARADRPHNRPHWLQTRPRRAGRASTRLGLAALSRPASIPARAPLTIPYARRHRPRRPSNGGPTTRRAGTRHNHSAPDLGGDEQKLTMPIAPPDKRPSTTAHALSAHYGSSVGDSTTQVSSGKQH